MLFDLQAKVGSVSFTTTPFRSSRPSRTAPVERFRQFQRPENRQFHIRLSALSSPGHIEGVHRFFQEAERYSMNISAAEQLVLAFESFELVSAGRLRLDQ